MHAIGIYAIHDTKADMIIGGLHLHKNDAAAIRMFDDVASHPESMLHKHPLDFELWKLGHLTGLDIHQNAELILTGEKWQALKVNP